MSVTSVTLIRPHLLSNQVYWRETIRSFGEFCWIASDLCRETAEFGEEDLNSIFRFVADRPETRGADWRRW